MGCGRLPLFMISGPGVDLLDSKVLALGTNRIRRGCNDFAFLTSSIIWGQAVSFM